MSEGPNYEKLLRSRRKSPLTEIGSLPLSLDYGRSDIEKIIPHRDPFLLIDRLIALDSEKHILAGSRLIPHNLPLFRGHFPDYPVYPGCLEVEMIGQLGLCLQHFIFGNTEVITRDSPPPRNVRATRILGAHFLHPVRPGDKTTIIAQAVEFDEYFGKVLGQVLVGSVVACVAVGEVAFLD